MVSTGTCMVPLPIAPGDRVVADFGVLGRIEAGLSGLSRTPEGNATVAAFMHAYNSMVVALRNHKAQEVKGGPGQGRGAQSRQLNTGPGTPGRQG